MINGFIGGSIKVSYWHDKIKNKNEFPLPTLPIGWFFKKDKNKRRKGGSDSGGGGGGGSFIANLFKKSTKRNRKKKVYWMKWIRIIRTTRTKLIQKFECVLSSSSLSWSWSLCVCVCACKKYFFRFLLLGGIQFQLEKILLMIMNWIFFSIGHFFLSILFSKLIR